MSHPCSSPFPNKGFVFGKFTITPYPLLLLFFSFSGAYVFNKDKLSASGKSILNNGNGKAATDNNISFAFNIAIAPEVEVLNKVDISGD